MCCLICWAHNLMLPAVKANTNIYKVFANKCSQIQIFKQCICKWMFTNTNIYKFVCKLMNTNPNIYKCICQWMFSNTNIYTYICKLMLTNPNIYKYICKWTFSNTNIYNKNMCCLICWAHNLMLPAFKANTNICKVFAN